MEVKPHPKREASPMVGFNAAGALVLDTVHAVCHETIDLADALWRISADDILADADQVPYPRSAMEGYALCARDTTGAQPDHPVVLPVGGSVFAEEGEAALSSGAAMAITTGAPVPQGADAVIPFEEVKLARGAIVISASVSAGNCIFPPGEDVRRGEILLRRGEIVRPAMLGLMALVGKSKLRVYRRPRVRLLCTGNELVDVHAAPGRGQIRNSNAFTLGALITECGAEYKYCGTAPDNGERLRRMLETARAGADALITTGGASVGERDLVKRVLAELGVEFRFRAVALRPGKPFGFGTWDGVLVFVLPGNPAAAFVCFHEFVRPALLRLAGCQRTALPVVRAILRGRAKSKVGRPYIILAQMTVTERGFEVTPLPNQCSVLVRTSADASALIILPEGPAEFGSGDMVDVQVLDWQRALPTTPNSSV
ncbi:MAG TPA: gephyrin-like molybdotransferase Glp [Acidobacteriota bacterium]|jgi:molybdopterin molybdotransferase|nr:gephyrin-like molybdotransferase Glp [Acidobacteriota bacterium]